jgi:hypothetical protein
MRRAKVFGCTGIDGYSCCYFCWCAVVSLWLLLNFFSSMPTPVTGINGGMRFAAVHNLCK